MPQQDQKLTKLALTTLLVTQNHLLINMTFKASLPLTLNCTSFGFVEVI